MYWVALDGDLGCLIVRWGDSRWLEKINQIVQCSIFNGGLYRERKRVGVGYTGYVIVEEVGP